MVRANAALRQPPGDAARDPAATRETLPLPRGLSLEPEEPASSGTIVLSFSLEAPPSRGAHWQRVTTSERAVLSLLLDGASNRRIASLRGTSERTVANQVSSIFRKLRVSSRLDLAVAAAHDQG